MGDRPETVSGKARCPCKGPEVEKCSAFLRNREKANMRVAWSFRRKEGQSR